MVEEGIARTGIPLSGWERRERTVNRDRSLPARSEESGKVKRYFKKPW